MNTIQEAKDYLKANADAGCDCPVCDRYVKIYKRHLNAGIVINLLEFYWRDNRKPGDWVHPYEIMRKNSSRFNMEYAKLGWWGLVEKAPPEVGGKTKSTGLWRITDKGKKFAIGHLTVPAKVHIYDDRIVGYSEEQTTVVGALQKKFDYQELMDNYTKGQWL